jgi:hypothetical protein
MRVVGRRAQLHLTAEASAERLTEGARWNDSLRPLAGGARIALARGVYRYRTHEEADIAWREAIAGGMAELVRRRRNG